jgi:hypothetical protein
LIRVAEMVADKQERAVPWHTLDTTDFKLHLEGQDQLGSGP